MELRHLRIGFEASVMRSGLSRVIRAFRREASGFELGLEELGSRAQSGYPGVPYALIIEPEIPIRMGVAWRQGEASPVVERFLEVTSEVAVRGGADTVE